MSAAGVKMHSLKHTLKKGGFWFSMGFICLLVAMVASILEYIPLVRASLFGVFFCLFFMQYWSVKHVTKGNKAVFRLLRKKLRNKKEGDDEPKS